MTVPRPDIFSAGLYNKETSEIALRHHALSIFLSPGTLLSWFPILFLLLLFSCQLVSDYLRPHGL